MDLPDDVASLVRSEAGACRVVADLTRPGHLLNRVWELEYGPRGLRNRLVVKQHASVTAHRRELAAYQKIVPALGDGTAPLLVAVSERTRTLLLTRIPGTPVSTLSLDASTEAEVYRQAGAVLATLHAQPAPAPAPGSITWQDKLAQAQGELLALPADAADMLADLLSGGPPPRLARVGVHGDWMPRNWLWDGRRLRVVDFEAATGASAASTDLARLGYRVLRGRPDLDAAFRTGYGRAFTRAEHQTMRISAALDALQALRWGRLHRDQDTLNQAHTMIQNLRADQDSPWATQRPGPRRRVGTPPSTARAPGHPAGAEANPDQRSGHPQTPVRLAASARKESRP
ncbi:aminoglycoside phosphotransferase family protein [Streptomyces sp. NPDC087440]|uniref:aminoglycoside phosphotransferase family protein n=1 Tax=Streptomyces sp. NPDC087440 TaxID=3365790 RepID=UPI0038027765